MLNIVSVQLERLHDHQDTLLQFSSVVEVSRELCDIHDQLIHVLTTATRRAPTQGSDVDDDNEEAVYVLQAAQRQRLAALTDLAVALNNEGSVLVAMGRLEKGEVRGQRVSDGETRARFQNY